MPPGTPTLTPSTMRRMADLRCDLSNVEHHGRRNTRVAMLLPDDRQMTAVPLRQTDRAVPRLARGGRACRAVIEPNQRIIRIDLKQCASFAASMDLSAASPAAPRRIDEKPPAANMSRLAMANSERSNKAACAFAIAPSIARATSSRTLIVGQSHAHAHPRRRRVFAQSPAIDAVRESRQRLCGGILRSDMQSASRRHVACNVREPSFVEREARERPAATQRRTRVQRSRTAAALRSLASLLPRCWKRQPPALCTRDAHCATRQARGRLARRGRCRRNSRRQAWLRFPAHIRRVIPSGTRHPLVDLMPWRTSASYFIALAAKRYAGMLANAARRHQFEPHVGNAGYAFGARLVCPRPVAESWAWR